MTAWDESVSAARSEFIEGMRLLGFGYDEAKTIATGVRTLTGQVHRPDGGPADVEVRLGPDWPYRPPKVTPASGTGSMSWHQEADSSLCLFSHTGHEMPWLNAGLLVEKIRDWFANDAASWPDDDPDLDLERYFESAGGPLVVYEDLEGLVGQTVRIAGNRYVEDVRRSGKHPDKLKKKHGRVVDLGQLDRPVRSWAEIAKRLGDEAADVEATIRAVGGGHLLALYRRGDHRAAVCLQASVADDEIVLRARASADRGQATLRLRAGAGAAALAERVIGVVGAGAVGSHVADQPVPASAVSCCATRRSSGPATVSGTWPDSTTSGRTRPRSCVTS